MNRQTLTTRAQSINPSPTIAVSSRARELREAGHDVIGLGAGEPDFDTPDHIKNAAITAIQSGSAAKYTAVDGIPALKDAVIEKFARENDLDYSTDQLLVSVGAKQCLFNLFLALIDAGDEVIIPAPYWVSYPDMCAFAGGTPVIVSADAGQKFKLSAHQLEAAITERSRLFIMNSPSNPTGACYSEKELTELAAVLLRHPQVWIVSDDIYEHIRWTTEPFCNLLTVCPDLRHRCVVINGVSKAYAMTGWRIGYAAGPVELIGAMRKIQSQSTSNPAAVSQAAAVAALRGDQHCVATMVAEFRQRHDHVIDRLNQIQGINVLPSAGTFYAFPDCAGIIASRPEINNDLELAGYLLDDCGVALVPGSAFGLEGHLRLSFATDMGTLNRALDRMQEALGKKS